MNIKKIDLGQILTILANFGVIIGILLLVLELQQNRQIMQSQIRNELSQSLIGILMEISNDAESASIYLRGNRGEELDEVESQRYRHMTISQLRYHENSFYQYQNGLFDEAEFLAQRGQWANLVFQSKGVVEVFCGMRIGLSQAFVAEIEGLLTTYQCESE